MGSKIFAIAHIGKFSIYIGTTEQLKARWEVIEKQLERGKYPNLEVQTAWNDSGNDCRFTFRTAQDIAQNPDVMGLHQFVDDLCEMPDEPHNARILNSRTSHPSTTAQAS